MTLHFSGKKMKTDRKTEEVAVPWVYPQQGFWVPLYTRQQTAFATLSYTPCCVHCTDRLHFQWNNFKGESCSDKHTAVCRQTLYARVTFTVVSTPTQILQAATESPLQSIHFLHIPLSELGRSKHPHTSWRGPQMSALIPNMRTLCMFGSFATTSTKTATVLRKNIGCL